jgi:hypothetical protein
MKKTVFLGGTCGTSTWRENLIERLTINYYNPVVPDWTPEVQAEELKQRRDCEICLYVITPEMQGVYSVAEVVDDSNKRPEKTVFYFDQSSQEFNPHQTKSLIAVGQMIEENGAIWCKTWNELIETLNERI